MIALLKRTFEQLSRQQDDYSYVAEAIVWLEMRGLPGLESVIDCLPELHACELRRAEPTANETLIKEYDAGNNSLLTTANSVVDAAIAGATNAATFHATVHNCTQQFAIVPELCRYSREGHAALAWWRDEAADVHVVMSTASTPNPDYWQLPGETAKQLDQRTLMLECSTDAELLRANIPEARATISSGDFAERHEFCLLNGIEIDAQHYRLCCEVADKILVESTDASRDGAGE